MTIRAIASGIRGVLYRSIRAGHPEQLPGLVPELVEWTMEYQRPDGEEVRRAAAAAAKPRPETAEKGAGDLDWREPPDSPRSRSELTQRERIVRAAGRHVFEKGYASLSIPTISATAGTSNQTFYETLRQQTRRLLRRLRRQCRRRVRRHHQSLRVRGRPTRGDRLRGPRDARAHRRQRALRPAHLLRPADGRARRAGPRRPGDGRLHGLPPAGPEAGRARGGRGAVPDACCTRSAAGPGR